MHDGRRGRRPTCPKSQLVVPADGPDRPAPEPDPRTCSRGRPDADVGRHRTAPRSSPWPRARTSSWPARATARWIAPHFVWAVREELADKLCGADVPTCDTLDQGGLTGHHDARHRLQKIAEKWVKAAAIVPNTKDTQGDRQGTRPQRYEPWMANLRNKDLHNGALVAMDYQTGEIVAYVGSADYYATATKPAVPAPVRRGRQGLPAAGLGVQAVQLRHRHRRPRRITAGTMLMDVGTDFGGGYTPNDADRLERGPVRVRNALQFSLNIPAVKAWPVNGPTTSSKQAKEFGMQFQNGKRDGRPRRSRSASRRSGRSTSSAPTATLGERRQGDPRTRRSSPSTTPTARPVQSTLPAARRHAGHRARRRRTSSPTSWPATRTRAINPFWGKFAIIGPEGRRPATLKTGTNNDAKDLNAYGYHRATDRRRRAQDRRLRARRRRLERQLRQHASSPPPASPLFSIDVTTYVWQGFLNEATAKWPETNFKRPADGLGAGQDRPVDRLSSRRPGKDVGRRVVHRRHQAARSARRPTRAASTSWRAGSRSRPPFDAWMKADRDWLRARGARPGRRRRPDRTRTAYFYNGLFHPYGPSWGVLVGGSAAARSPSPTCYIVPDPGSERRRPVIRAPDADPSGDRGPSLPHAIPSEDTERRPVRGGDAAAKRGATADADAGPTDADARTDADADTRTDPDPDAGAARPVTDVAIDVRGLLVRREGRAILGPLDWTVRDGERWVVIGPNGSGKTTLLSVGRPGRCGRRRDRRRARRAVRPDRFARASSADRLGRQCDRGVPPARPDPGDARDDGAPRRDRTVVARLLGRRPAAGARACLATLGLERVADHAYGTLSAGERRRTSIARALMPDPGPVAPR